jgi:hypothetical protein
MSSHAPRPSLLRWHALALALVLATAIVSGCTRPSEPEPGADAGVPSDAAAVEFCREYMASYCARDLECTGGKVADMCHPDLVDARCEALGQASAQGRLRFVATESAACLAELKGSCATRPVLSFAAPINNDRICPRVFQGVGAEGAACSFWEECAEGTYCSVRVSYPATDCPGRCTPFGGWVQCPPGTSYYVRGNTCVATATEGQGCGDLSPSKCGQGLYCKRSGNEQSCASLEVEGTACTQSSECAEGLTCAGPEGARTCQRIKPPGASCTVGWNECARDYGVTCSGASGRCEWAGIGDACGLLATGERAGCVEGYCDAPPGNGFPPEGPGVCRAWTSTSANGHSCGPSLRWTPVSGECLGVCLL